MLGIRTDLMRQLDSAITGRADGTEERTGSAVPNGQPDCRQANRDGGGVV